MANRSVISVAVSIVLIAQAVQAEPSRACRTFEACAELAARRPSQFSRALAVSLRGLPAAVLVEGLDWTHPLPAVAARAHLQAEEALRFAGRHSIDSARKLLKHAASRPNDMLKREWFTSLARDPKGRQVLAEVIDAQPESPLRLFACMASVQQLWRSDALRARGRRVPARVDRCVDTLWQQYLSVRLQPVPDAQGGPISDETWLRNHVLYADAYQRRIKALVESEVDEGRAPVVQELASLASHRRGDHRFASRLVSWTESPNRLLRRQALDVLLRELARWNLTANERVRIRRSLLAADADGDYAPFESVSAALLDLREAAPPEDVDRMLEIAQREPGLNALKLMAELSEQLSTRRGLLVAKFDAPEYGTAEVLASLLRDTRLPRLRAALVDWFLDIKPDALWDERLQERILVLVPALPGEPDPSVEEAPFPPSRRVVTAVRREQSREDVENEEEDRKAFGLPPRAEKAATETSAPVAAPLTSEEKLARWNAFVLAVHHLQEKLRTSEAVH